MIPKILIAENWELVSEGQKRKFHFSKRHSFDLRGLILKNSSMHQPTYIPKAEDCCFPTISTKSRYI